jgi:hypothetical protein
MTILRELRRFVEAKNIDGERHEIREYVLAHAETLAPAFGTSAEHIAETLEIIDDDATLAGRLLKDIKRRESEVREERRGTKYERAQAAAGVIASQARWEGNQLHFDLPALLATALTRRTDLLVFATERFDVAVHMKPLLALAQLKRKDLRGYVDSRGVHIRWGTGGLSFCPKDDCAAERIVVSVLSAAEQAA